MSRQSSASRTFLRFEREDKYSDDYGPVTKSVAYRLQLPFGILTVNPLKGWLLRPKDYKYVFYWQPENSYYSDSESMDMEYRLKVEKKSIWVLWTPKTDEAKEQYARGETPMMWNCWTLKFKTKRIAEKFRKDQINAFGTATPWELYEEKPKNDA